MRRYVEWITRHRALVIFTTPARHRVPRFTWALRAKASYAIDDHWKAVAGFDYFTGETPSLFQLCTRARRCSASDCIVRGAPIVIRACC